MAEEFDLEKARCYVSELGRLGSRPGLGRIKELCDRLGNPEADLRFIHIAGTNGKGSTGAMIASVLAKADLMTGMYYSPAISGITDHYMINGELISDREWASCVSAVAAANEKMKIERGESATQFEFETAAAYVYFKKKHCDVVILECGMGGRDDATNTVTDKICCVITSISEDHMQYLGDTLEKIAEVKAGIITSDCPVIAFGSSPEVVRVIRNRCEHTGSKLYTVDPGDIMSRYDRTYGQSVSFKEYRDIPIGLNGTYQSENAAVALQTLSVIRECALIGGLQLDDDTVLRGMKNAKWPYRFECINRAPLMFVDGAHNADAAVKLHATIRRELDGYRIILVMGMFADKEYDKVVGTLADTALMIFTVEAPDNPRALPAAELAKCASRYCDNVRACNSIRDAYDRSVHAAKEIETEGNGPAAVIACGSLSYLYTEYHIHIY